MNEREIAIMNEAFMVGRIYSMNNEKESPVEISAKLTERCEAVARPFQTIHNKDYVAAQRVICEYSEAGKKGLWIRDLWNWTCERLNSED